MKIKDNYIETCTAATVNDITESFTDIQQRINRLQDSASSQDHVNFNKKHCLTTVYLFQIKNAKTKAAIYVLYSLCDSQKKITEVYGSVPTKKEKPSLKFSLEITEEYKQKKAVLGYQKVTDIIKCSNCRRPRCTFVNAKLNCDLTKHLLKSKRITNKPVVVQSSPMKILADVDFLLAVN